MPKHTSSRAERISCQSPTNLNASDRSEPTTTARYLSKDQISRVDETTHALTGGSLRVRLEGIFSALRARAQPTLLLFDTFEQGGEWAGWVEEHALQLVPRAPWLRLLIAGQQIPRSSDAAWKSLAEPVIALESLGWKSWYEFGKRHHPDLRPDFIREVHTLSDGNHSLLSQLLSPPY